MNPGATGPDNPGATGAYGSCDNSANPTDPNSGNCTGPGQGTPIPPAKRIFKGIELVVRKQFTNEIWAQLSYLGSTLTGNYSGAIREASGQTDPGINADYDYAQFMQQLLRPPRARPAEPGPDRRGLQRAVGPFGRPPVLRPHRPADVELGYFNGFYGSTLYIKQRGYAGRLPTDYEMNLSLGYNMNVGP